MMKILVYISFVLAMLIPCKRALHMFQQNRYELPRYSMWLKSWRATRYDKLASLCFIAVFFKKHNIAYAIFIGVFSLIAVLYYLDENKKNYIKPLVYTARVKRQIAVLTILVLLIVFLCYKIGFIWLLIALVTLLPWLLIYPLGIITDPIEASIRNGFMNEARAILKDHNNLIKIGITGSYGKTSTKNIIQSMISEQYNSLMTPASFNTPNGITITIREMLKPIHQVFVCEMGADKVGEITELVNFVKPSIGVVTSIGPQHLATFGSLENIIKEKMQMIELLPKDGIGIINVDNEYIRNYEIKNKDVKVITYGITSEDADYRACDITYTPNGSHFNVVHNGEKYEMETKLLGEHNVLNILSSIACARELNVPWEVVQKGAKSMKQVEHRLEIKKFNGYRFIDDAFNSNPVGSAMALEVMSYMPNKRFIVTPGMIDLGAIQDETNKEFGKKMKDKVDVVILVGKQQTSKIYEGLEEVNFDMNNVHIVDNVKEAFNLVYREATPEDTILLENDLPDAFSH